MNEQMEAKKPTMAHDDVDRWYLSVHSFHFSWAKGAQAKREST